MFSNFKNSNFKKKKSYNNALIMLGLFSVGILLCILFITSLFSSAELPADTRVSIKKGYSIVTAGRVLEKEGIINSAIAFRLLAQLEDLSIKSGQYIFEKGDLGLEEVLRRLSRADYGDVYERITIPEGSTNAQIYEAIKRSEFLIDEQQFIELTDGTEGYLFPDTYNFLPETDLEKIISTIRGTFDMKIKLLKDRIESSGRSLEDVIIMASIIEKEATGDINEKKIVSGILWKRLDEGKLLQVDAPFQYINGTVRAADLRKDGPYNTYTRKGLTPTPIGNPGLDSILAAIGPKKTEYYYYLHGKDGKIRYGVSYNDHINNINRYLR